MTVLNHLGEAAAIILLIELLVIVLVFFAVCAGLAFGVHWSRGKTGWAFEKVNAVLPKVQHYADLANHYLALPVIKGTAFARTARTTIDTIERQIRALRAAQTPPVESSVTIETTTVVPVVAPEPPEPVQTP